MKPLFQIRFLLWMIGFLLLVLYLQWKANALYRLGGPVEIVYAQGYARHLLQLGLRSLVAGFGVPCGIGLLVYGYQERTGLPPVAGITLGGGNREAGR